MKIRLTLICFVAASIIAHECLAATITLNANQQTWISPTNSGSYRTTPRGTDTTINVRGGSASTSASTGSARMLGIVEFDLSQVPGSITSAYLQLYMDPGAGNQGTATQTANFIPLQNPAYAGGPAGPSPGGDIDTSTLTYATYAAAGSYGPTDFAASQFGTIAFTGPVAVSAYTQSASTDATDLAYLQGVQGSSLPHLGLLLANFNTTTGSSQTRHDWSNGNTATDGGVAHPPQLIVEYTVVPEPAAFTLAIFVVGMVAQVRRRSRK